MGQWHLQPSQLSVLQTFVGSSDSSEYLMNTGKIGDSILLSSIQSSVPVFSQIKVPLFSSVANHLSMGFYVQKGLLLINLLTCCGFILEKTAICGLTVQPCSYTAMVSKLGRGPLKVYHFQSFKLMYLFCLILFRR